MLWDEGYIGGGDILYCTEPAEDQPVPSFLRKTWEPLDFPMHHADFDGGPYSNYFPMPLAPERWRIENRSTGGGTLSFMPWTDADASSGRPMYVENVHRYQYLPHGRRGMNISRFDGSTAWYQLDDEFLEHVSGDEFGGGGPATTVRGYWNIAEWVKAN